MIQRLLVLTATAAWLLSACGSPETPEAVLCEGDFVPSPEDFTCSTSWHQVGNLRITNKCGKLEEALDVAINPKAGRRYPVGTMITLLTSEAMVKRGAGFDPDFNDWEYFTLNTSPTGATISKRGRREVKNDVGSCLECHQGARDFDFVCMADHGCERLPIPAALLKLSQDLDSRCLPP